MRFLYTAVTDNLTIMVDASLIKLSVYSAQLVFHYFKTNIATTITS